MPPAEQRPLRIAILGCGAIARQHAATLRRFPGIKVGFASRDFRRAESYAAQYRGFRAYPSYTAAVEDRTVDATLIATPPAEHFRLVLESLLGGKHALVEKPAFRDTAEADLIIAAAKDTGRLVLVLENYGYKPVTRVLRTLIGAGEVGDVRHVRLNALKWQDQWGWRGDAELCGGGALFEGGIHWLHLLATLGPEVDSVEGFAPPVRDGAERSMLVVARYRNGAIGTLHHAWDAPVQWRGLALSHVIGSRGTITFESNGLVVGVRGVSGRRVILPGLRDIRGFRAMFADFIEAIRTGRPPTVTLERARADLALVEQAYRTAGLCPEEPIPC